MIMKYNKKPLILPSEKVGLYNKIESKLSFEF